MKVSAFYLPSVGSRAQIERGLAGLRPELHQQMLRALSEQAKLADALGFDSISFTEHHFHVEGFEISNNPVLLDLFVGMQTRRIRVGQLGIVLPAQNPIRVAEDIAMLDPMTGGRTPSRVMRTPLSRAAGLLREDLRPLELARLALAVPELARLPRGNGELAREVARDRP